MNVEAMNRMKTFLFKDKSVASTKLGKMHEYFQPVPRCFQGADACVCGCVRHKQ